MKSCPVTKHTLESSSTLLEKINTALWSAITVVHVAASDGLQLCAVFPHIHKVFPELWSRPGKPFPAPPTPPPKLLSAGSPPCHSSKAFHSFPDPNSHAIRFLFSPSLKSLSLKLKFTSRMEDLPFFYLGFCILPSDFLL